MRDEKNIQKMLDFITKIERYSTGKNYESFVADEMLVEACVFNLTQLGETAHKRHELQYHR